MPRVRFTADPVLPLDWRHLPYREGYEADMTADQANRWLRRGVAVIVPEATTMPARRPAAADHSPTSRSGAEPDTTTGAATDTVPGGGSAGSGGQVLSSGSATSSGSTASVAGAARGR